MSRCIGCGIKLQDTEKDSLGYTPKLDNLYCERCFKTIHYNEYKKINNFNNNDLINRINKLNCFTFFITDLISINEELINIYKSINNDKIFIINKNDLIPSNLDLKHISANIKETYKIDEDLLFVSAKRDALTKIKDIIDKKKKVLFVGETGSGKSTLINNITGCNLTTSEYENTTLDFIKIKYEDNCIYDSPGLNVKESLIKKDKINLLTKQMKEEYALIINDLKLSLDGNVTIISSNLIDIKTKKNDSNKLIKNYIDDNSDIVFDGGFIYIKESTICYSSKELEIRKSIIGR